jgi:hypothetical protein
MDAAATARMQQQQNTDLAGKPPAGRLKKGERLVTAVRSAIGNSNSCRNNSNIEYQQQQGCKYQKGHRNSRAPTTELRLSKSQCKISAEFQKDTSVNTRYLSNKNSKHSLNLMLP